MSQGSKAFRPFRTVGVVIDDQPFHLKRMGDQNFLTVSIGKAWQVFNCEKLRLALVGPEREGDIVALTSVRIILLQRTVATYGCGSAWRRCTH
eukprot:g1004.t1